MHNPQMILDSLNTNHFSLAFQVIDGFDLHFERNKQRVPIAIFGDAVGVDAFVGIINPRWPLRFSGKYRGQDFSLLLEANFVISNYRVNMLGICMWCGCN